MSTKLTNPDRRVRRTKKVLKDSLISLLLVEEFKDITITEIVKKADINRGTFYKHYQYKEDLLNEVIHDNLSELVDSFRDPYVNVESFDIKMLSSSSIKIFDHIQKQKNFYKLALNPHIMPGYQNKIGNVFKKLALADLLHEDDDNNINSNIQASFYSYALLGMIIQWVEDDCKHSPIFMSEQLLKLIKIS